MGFFAKTTRFFVRLALYAGIFLVFAGGGSLTYFHYAPPSQTCLTCHEMQGVHDRWTTSSHANVHCRNCHGGSLTLDVHALQEHANRVIGHFATASHENTRLSHEQVLAVSDRCKACHATEAAHWHTGHHQTTYARIFLDESQNQRELLYGDCLRCHGMFFDGTIEQLVTPIDNKGPWKMVHPEMATQPAVPCLACHQVHAAKPAAGATAASHYSRHEKEHFTAESLPIAAMKKAGRPVRVSPDPRQRLCVQCHAPRAQHAVGSGDDRTPTGVHEGLSCVACHNPHSGDAKASCVTCHPALSHCGLDVHTMDTSFKSRRSKHNIHSVDCADCHQGKRPTTRPAAVAQTKNP